jgi:hypothetical protein
MVKKKSAKGAPKGQLSAEIVESICAGLAFDAEEELRQCAAWEDWCREAAEAWHSKHEEGLQSGLSVKAAVREAGTAARERAAVAAREWAAAWLSGRGDVVLRSLPSREEYEAMARDGAAGLGRVKGAVEAIGEGPSPMAAAAAGIEQALGRLVAASAADALRHGREFAALAGERRTMAQALNEQQRESWEEAFAVDAIRSIEHVRSEVVATALAVLQDAAFERARAVADTISRQLAMDATCGRVRATLDEIRASGRGQPSTRKNPEEAQPGPSIFWRDVRRAAAKVLSRQDVHRLLSLRG